MHGSGHNRRRKKGRKDPPFSLRAILSSFHTAEGGGREGREGGGKGDPEKRGSDIRDEKVGDSPIAR